MTRRKYPEHGQSKNHCAIVLGILIRELREVGKITEAQFEALSCVGMPDSLWGHPAPSLGETIRWILGPRNLQRAWRPK